MGALRESTEKAFTEIPAATPEDAVSPTSQEDPRMSAGSVSVLDPELSGSITADTETIGHGEDKEEVDDKIDENDGETEVKDEEKEMEEAGKREIVGKTEETEENGEAKS